MGAYQLSIFTSTSRPVEPVSNSEHRELNLIERVGRPLGHRYVELRQTYVSGLDNDLE